MADDLLVRALELRQRGEPFVLATVVRCERPTSAKPGAKALIRDDGTVFGWIGGACAEPVVMREALNSLRDGQPRVIRLIGEGGKGPGRTEGVIEYAMTCHSGGTMEIYLEPTLPRPQLLLVGHGPVVETLAKLGEATEFTVVETSAECFPQLRDPSQTFVVVATHGTADEEALERALRSGAFHVSLVASRKRAGAVIDALRARGVPVEQLGRVKAPAGLDIHAVTPEEIAVSILAEIIQVSRGQKAEWKSGETPLEEAGGTETDPVCGMLVEIASAKYRSEVSGRPVYFCCAGCKRSFDREPARYARSRGG
jgi:xanthine dehydrogenase accessory factor